MKEKKKVKKQRKKGERDRYRMLKYVNWWNIQIIVLERLAAEN